jgi:uncharacterized protein
MTELAVFAVSCVFAVSPAAFAEEPRIISTSGSAEIKVAPDEVEITIGIETRDKNLLTAKKQNSDRQQRLMAVLASYKIPAKNIQTDFIGIEPEYTTERNGERTLNDYMVRRSFAVLLKDFSRFDNLLTEVLQAGANHVSNIQFRTTELRKHRDRARTMAIQAARDKAVALAKELGQKVGRPRTINEGGGGWGRFGGGWGGGRYQQNVQNMQPSSAEDPGDSSGLSLGQISVTASVSVTFELE